jgi:hypothetical protein
MKFRAWLNNDPKSNEITTHVFSTGTNLGKTTTRLVREYQNDRKAHIAQLSNEVVELQLICNKHNLYKDIFCLLRNKYIFRPVEKPKQQKKKSFVRYQPSFCEKIAGLVLVFGLLLAILAWIGMLYTAIKNNKI